VEEDENKKKREAFYLYNFQPQQWRLEF